MIITKKNFTMSSALLLSILGISAGLQHCPMWKEIAPCSCRMDSEKVTKITCEKMSSFGQVVDILRGHFSPTDRMSIAIAYSSLPDLPYRSYKELNVTLTQVKLNHDHFGPLNQESFDGLTKVKYLSLADSVLNEVPETLWKKMPNIATLDLGRTKIKYLSDSSFRDLPRLEALVLPGNHITRMDRNSIPTNVNKLHIGRNYIRDLNDTLRNITDLGWLFVNTNYLTTLENQLPIDSANLKLLHAGFNQIDKLPQQLKSIPGLTSLFFQHNLLTSLDGALSRSKHLERLVLEYNRINTIAKEDFQELEVLESLLLGNNEITTLNNSLLNLKNLNFLNVSKNKLTEFSFQDVVGLQELRSIDLSYNHITTLIGPAANLIEWNIKLNELILDNNRLETLNGALSGLPELLRLNLSFNRLKRISPDDFIGLDQLRLLDISHNDLTTLEETSKTFLPRLSELKASHNHLTILEKDFHGLPVLCHADLSNNQIVALGRDLVTKTRCKIEHGVHEGTWDTLKIYLQDNPILCDAALPEIMSAMEINHTRIYGVSHCPPLSEQPVTAKPNAFLGYVPDTTQSTVPANVQVESQPVIYKPSFDPKPHSDPDLNEPPNQIQPKITNFPYPETIREPAVELRMNEQYRINDEPITEVKVSTHIIEPVSSKPSNDSNKIQQDNSDNDNRTQNFDPITQGQQITKLASEIEELRTRIDQLSTQNELLLNKTILEQRTLVLKPSNENLEETRKA